MKHNTTKNLVVQHADSSTAQQTDIATFQRQHWHICCCDWCSSIYIYIYTYMHCYLMHQKV